MPVKKRIKSGLTLNAELTPKQQEFFKIMSDPSVKVVFLSGAAGTSKTWLSFYTGLYLLDKGLYDKVLYLRNPIESSRRSLGALKGFLEDKIAVYIQVCKEKLMELLPPEQANMLISSGAVEGDVINFIRGRSLSDQVIILDEASNCDLQETETVIGRMNYNTKLFICGDSRQSDIKNDKYDKICERFSDEEANARGIYHLHFEREDIMRDPIIGFMLDRMDSLY